MFSPLSSGTVKTTSYKVVLPFYIYAAVSFLIGSVFLLTSATAFSGHYFQPHLLAITHTMALGWATMIILGASHQLVPVLIEGKLYSEPLAHLSFIFAALGIPLLVHGFYIFDLGIPAQVGGSLVALAVITYLVNITVSMVQSKRENVHAVFIFTSVVWLLFTVLLGLTLLINFTTNLLPQNSLHYLSLHAHAGLVGWFLLLVFGVASRLIPLFLISKYTNPRLLWIIYSLINAGLIFYVVIFFIPVPKGLEFIPVTLILIAVVLFIYFTLKAHQKRLRKKVDEQVNISLLSAMILLLPVILLLVFIVLLIYTSGEKANIILTYGFLVFFGWLTSIILGMTFKTLPFIVWNKVYRNRSANTKTPNPKDLFDNQIFRVMSFAYLSGLVLFASGILFSQSVLLKGGAVLLIVTAILYNWNVFKVINHKATTL